jgi:hypothetical protein
VRQILKPNLLECGLNNIGQYLAELFLEWKIFQNKFVSIANKLLGKISFPIEAFVK